MPVIMMLMHAYGRLIHRPEPRPWTAVAYLPPLEASAPVAPWSDAARAG